MQQKYQGQHIISYWGLQLTYITILLSVKGSKYFLDLNEIINGSYALATTLHKLALYTLIIKQSTFIEFAKHFPQSFIHISTFNPHNNYGTDINSKSHFIDQGTVAQRQ